MIQVKATIYNDFFERLEDFLNEGIYNFQKKEIRDIKIFMPNYFLKMWQQYLTSKVCYQDSDQTLSRYRGIEIVDNYYNTIVISFKDIQLSKKLPYTLIIP